jgi:16S rRNA (uracil1498-N3)-methyltransferase
MPRFFCPTLPQAPAAPPPDPADRLSDSPPRLVTLDDQETHHARRVLRLEPGAALDLFDGRGTIAQGTLQSWTGGATVRLMHIAHVPALRPTLDLAVAIPKGPRADEMVNQLSQLGVDRLIPLRTQRGVVDPRAGKIEKFTRITIESAKQCGRAWLMEVAEPATVEETLRGPHDLRLLAAPGAPATSAHAGRLHSASRVLALIGPEGGWTEEETGRAAAAGALGWSLGPHVLRIETAAIVAAALARGCA